MPTPTYSTADTILTQARAETSVGSNPVSTALQDTAMLRRLNDINSEFVNSTHSVGMLGWTFLMAEQIIETKTNTALNGAISSGATSLVVDDASIWTDPAGTIDAGYIRTGNRIYDFFSFESISSNTLNTVSGIQIDHANDTQVHKIYKLPADFGKPRAMFRRSNDFEYLYEDDDFRQIPRSNKYSIKTLTSTNGNPASFVVFREDVGSQEFKFNYQKAPTTISATTNSVDAPDGTPRRYIVEKLKEYIWNVLGEEQDATLALQRANESLRAAMSEWGTQQIQPKSNVTLLW